MLCLRSKCYVFIIKGGDVDSTLKIFKQGDESALIRYRSEIDNLLVKFIRHSNSLEFPLVRRRGTGSRQTDKQWAASYLKRNGMIILAVETTHILGMVQTLEGEFEDSILIDTLFVLDKYRGRGIGSTLMDKVSEVVKKDKVRYLLLSVHAANPKAIRFYKRYGFNPEMTLMSAKVK